jgi:hypothetical protein
MVAGVLQIEILFKILGDVGGELREKWMKKPTPESASQAWRKKI